MSRKITEMKNNCTLIAVQEVSQKSDEQIFKAFEKNDYVPNQGMYTNKWINAARQLGLELERECTLKDCFDEDGLVTHMDYYTLAEFLREFSTGVYFVLSRGHAYVVRNGKVIDPNRRNNMGLRRRVIDAYKVLNPAPKKPKHLTPYIHIPRYGVKGGYSKAAWRFYRASVYMHKNQDRDVTLEELIENTTYTRADFRHDLKKGFIEYKERNDD